MVAERIQLPGFGLPVDHRPEKRFRNAIWEWTGTILDVRELNMMAIMETITNKTDWDTKIFDDTIVQTWRQEAFSTKIIRLDLSEKMLDYCIAELRDKARFFQSHGMIPTLDLDVAVIKSDTAVTSDLKAALRAAAAPLEHVPDKLKDWRPGSDGKVLDLVDPSLFSLIYSRSRILPSGVVGLQDCVNDIGKGEVATTPDHSLENVQSFEFWSTDFQWLPCDVMFVGNDVKITSYINNLHPNLHADLYSVIEKFIAKAIPLWDLALASTIGEYRKTRILIKDYYDYPWNDWKTRRLYQKITRIAHRPEPRDFESYQPSVDDRVDLREEFGTHGLQVIVKLANIELTPEKPAYDGGSWHVEGQLNESICATALYYYDTKNIADNCLSFRHHVEHDEVRLGPDDEDIEKTYGFRSVRPKRQEIGKVEIREGRLLAFPNVLHHREAPFKLEDPSKPGHRKLLALFLIDPHCRIISTANVPPQQKDWRSGEIQDSERFGRMSPEIVDEIMEDVNEVPISLEEAKELRLKLMEEMDSSIQRWM